MKINVKPIIAALLCTALMVCTACSGGKTETGKPESADSKASTVSEAASDTSKNDTVSAASSENSTGESITEESESSDEPKKAKAPMMRAAPSPQRITRTKILIPRMPKKPAPFPRSRMMTVPM